MTDANPTQPAIEDLLASYPVDRTEPAEFLGARFDAGLAWVHFAPGAGGLGIPPSWQQWVDMRLALAGAPTPEATFVARFQAATAVHDAGSPQQRSRFLRTMFTGEEQWCQLFSEPGAGSDLAGLSTLAVRDGEGWRVNGQKVWTSEAVGARWAILIARTDPDAPKHQGLTLFICDMRAPGVETRPLRQADGASQFNEVFLTDVFLHDDLRVGPQGGGWGVSTSALHAERDGVGTDSGLELEGGVDALLALWRATQGRSEAERGVLRQRLVRILIEERLLHWTNLRMHRARQGGADAAGSLAKLRFTQYNQAALDLCMDLAGPQALVDADYDANTGRGPRSIPLQFIRSRANSIEGGTSEVMRNIIGERVLGLPREPGPDRDTPWRHVRRA